MEPLTLIGAFCFMLWLAFAWAKVEIAIEGGHGWAELLPTWRLPAHHWASMMFTGGRTLTGFHMWINIFILSSLHFLFLFIDYSVKTELFIIAFYLMFLVAEDFIWFVVNPAFGITKFHPKYIWWHKDHWWIFMPRDYYVLTAISALLYYISLHI